jgi:predicted ATPase
VSTEPGAAQQAKVTVRKGGPEALLTDVGFGVSQVLPVVTLLQYVPEGATVILEQPEIHLHPLAQANLADVLINAAIHRKYPSGEGRLAE